MANGWIILDKPPGLGSTQAVSAVKRNLREAGFGKVRVGQPKNSLRRSCAGGKP